MTRGKACGALPRRSGLVAALVVAAFSSAPGPVLAAPRVVATVKPLHSLVAGVMAGIGEPELIVRGAASPHTYSIKPSEARLLERAQIIFWVGGSLETFMEKPLKVLGAGALVVEAMQAPGISLRTGRAGGDWDAHDDADSDHDTAAAPAGAGEDAHATHDGHLWLDPANARAVVRQASDALGRSDPENRERYAANAAVLLARIDALDAELKLALAPVRDLPFVVFHDAYQYFEARYALRAVGAVTVSAERKPGARRVKEIRDTIRRLGARCVFSEPQFPPALLATLLEGLDARTGVLDPLGAALPAGPDAYFALMRGLGSSIAGCLQPR